MTAVRSALTPLAPVVPGLAERLGIATRSALAGTVALTFDDGPHPQGTPAVLEALAREGARATFFLVGEQVLRSPALAAEITAAGHAVALHGHRHRALPRLPRRALRADLDRCAAAVGEATGAAPRLHRAPYGVYSSGALHELRARGLTPLLWSRWGRDWRRRATAESILATIGGELTAGEVVLLHDSDRYSAAGSWRATAAALPRLLEAVAASGLHTAPLTGPAEVAQPSGR